MFWTRIRYASCKIASMEIAKAIHGKKFGHWNVVCRCCMEIKDVSCTPEELVKMLFNEINRDSPCGRHIFTIKESDEKIGVLDGFMFKKSER